MRLKVIDRPCAISPVCCRPTTPRFAPPHSRTASFICGEFVPKTRWYALYSLSLIFDALARFTASQSSSKSVTVCASGPSYVIFQKSSIQTLPARSVLPFLHGASSGATSSLVPSLSTLSAKMPGHKLRCSSTTRMRGFPFDRYQLFLYSFLRVSPD